MRWALDQPFRDTKYDTPLIHRIHVFALTLFSKTSFKNSYLYKEEKKVGRSKEK
jgi:hypothetical protein